MEDFAAKLLTQKQFRLEKSGAYLFNERISLLPAYSFIQLQKQLIRHGESFISYNVFKKMSFRWVKNFKNMFKVEGRELAVWARDVSVISGWGTSRFEEEDWTNYNFKVELDSSPIPETIILEEGFTEKPVDHMFRGIAAGGLSAITGKDIEAVETHCKAMGEKTCKFTLRPLEEFNLRKPFIREQLLSSP